MGQVYLAHDPVLDREVAVKLIGSEIDDADGATTVWCRRPAPQDACGIRTSSPSSTPASTTARPYIAMEHVAARRSAA